MTLEEPRGALSLKEFTRPDGTFLPLTTLRPSYQHQQNRIVVSNALRQRRDELVPSDLFEALASKFATTVANNELSSPSTGSASIVDPKTVSQTKHWYERGWHPSLEYYLWSRKCTYFDENDPTQERRAKAVSSYLQMEAPPERVVPDGPVFDLLPPHSFPSDRSLGKLLIGRRTIRGYLGDASTLPILSSVLWWGLDGVRKIRSRPIIAPLDFLNSYGVAFDFFPVLYNVEGIPAGAYYYDLLQHKLVSLRQGLFRSEMKRNTFDHVAPNTACWTILIAADFPQFMWRYRHERALRNLYLETGRLSQKLLLAGMAFGLGTLTTPATRDRDLNHLLKLDILRQTSIYTLTMGVQKKSYVEAEPE